MTPNPWIPRRNWADMVYKHTVVFLQWEVRASTSNIVLCEMKEHKLLCAYVKRYIITYTDIYAFKQICTYKHTATHTSIQVYKYPCTETIPNCIQQHLVDLLEVLMYGNYFSGYKLPMIIRIFSCHFTHISYRIYKPMYSVLFFWLVWLYHRCCRVSLNVFTRDCWFVSPALEPSYDCSTASESILNAIGESCTTQTKLIHKTQTISITHGKYMPHNICGIYHRPLADTSLRNWRPCQYKTSSLLVSYDFNEHSYEWIMKWSPGFIRARHCLVN